MMSLSISPILASEDSNNCSLFHWENYETISQCVDRKDSCASWRVWAVYRFFCKEMKVSYQKLNTNANNPDSYLGRLIQLLCSYCPVWSSRKVHGASTQLRMFLHKQTISKFFLLFSVSNFSVQWYTENKIHPGSCSSSKTATALLLAVSLILRHLHLLP